MWRRASLAFVGVSLTACAAATSYPNPAFVNAGRNVLTAAEIVSARVTDAYQAVIQLRPEFLRHRVAATIPAFAPVVVEVYLDNMPFGTAEALRSIPLERVRLIRYLSPSEADLLWGGTHSAGVILVTTLR